MHVAMGNKTRISIYNCLVVSTPLKNMNFSWEYYSQHMESHKIHVPNHQPNNIGAGIHQEKSLSDGESLIISGRISLCVCACFLT